jgi:TonB family protein
MNKQNLDKGILKRSCSNITRLAMYIIVLFSCTAKADLLLNGSTIYSDLGKDQFVAALYTETAQNKANIIQSMNSEKRMEVRMINNYSMRRWINLWMQSISINNGRETFSDSAEELIALMQAPKSAPKKGDILEYIFSPENGTSMRFNGTELISDLSGEVFGLLLRTWIGAIPHSTSFKEELLGNKRNNHSNNLLANITPNPERISLAESWIVPQQSAVDESEQVAAKEITKPSTESNKSTAKKDSSITGTPEIPTTEIADIIEPPNKEGTSAQDTDSQKPDLNSTASATIETESTDEAEEEIVDFNVAEALAQRDYTPLVVQQIYQHISYPSRAASKNQQGTVRIAVEIGRDGELKSLLTTQESKYSSLNKAAMKAVAKAAPFPTLPENIKSDSFELSIPITFRLQ